jgi:hypothetical protein
MPTVQSIVKVQTMYVAYYGRPGDPGGVDFWAGKLDGNDGNLDEIIDAFGDSKEFIDNYGDLNPQELVATLYQQILGREPDAGGLLFYIELLNSGAKSLASIALDIANGVQGGDIDTLANKLEVAQAFTDVIVLTGAPYSEDELPAAKQLIADIDSGDASVDAALALIAQLAAAAGEDTVPDDFSTDTTLTFDDPVISNVNYFGDIDVVAVELAAGVEYQFTMGGLSSGSGTLLDPWLGLYDGSEDYPLSDDDSGKGIDSYMVFTPDTAGTYYLAAQSAGGSTIGSYTLSMDWVGNDTIAGDVSTGASLMVGETLSSHLDSAADEDWFSIELTEGIQYSLTLASVDSDGGSLADPVVALYDESGTLVLEDVQNYTPTVSGSYYLAAASSSGDTGSYSLAVREPFNTTALTITFEDPDGELNAFRTVIEDNLQAAWDNWDLYIDGEYGAVLDIVIRPFTEVSDGNGGVTLATASPEFYVGVGDYIVQGAPAEELRSGSDTNGDEPDGSININTYTLEQDSYFDFDTSDDFTPFFQVNFEDVLTHELGHVLGFDGWFDGGDYHLPFEALLDQTTIEFLGERAVALNGGPVALDEDSLVHLDQATFQEAMMTPLASDGGIDEITELEIAMLADIGLPIHEQYLII